MVRTFYLLALAATLGVTSGAAGLASSKQALFGSAESAPPVVDSEPVEAAALGSLPLSLARAPDGLFYVTLPINGHPIRFVVDTGASVVVLSRQDARRAGIDAHGLGADRLDSVGGNFPMRWGTIPRLTIGNTRVDQVQIAIVDGGLKTSLLGQNVLSRLGSVRMTGERLELN